MDVDAGATASGLTVEGGGELVIYGGATVTGLNVEDGGLEILASGAVETISSGAVAQDLEVAYGGELIIQSGGSPGSATVIGGTIVFAGGTVTRFQGLGSGAHVEVGSGATVNGLVNYGSVGTEVVSSGGIATNTTLDSASEIVLSGGTTNGTILNTGATEIVSAGGIITGVETFGGKGRLSFGNTTGVALVFSGFDKTDTLDLTAFAFNGSESFSFVENGANTSGTLTITDGVLHASVTLFGQYTAAGFNLASDGADGTAVIYTLSAGGVSPLVHHAAHSGG